MKADDVTDTLEAALEASGLEHANVVHKPRLLSDNGASYVAGDIQMIDSSSIRVHQHAAMIKKRKDPFSGQTAHRTVSFSLKPWVVREAA